MAAHLFGKDGEDFLPQAVAATRADTFRETDTVVGDGEFAGITEAAQRDADFTISAVGEGVLETVREGFIQREGKGHEPFLLYDSSFEIEVDLDALGGDSIALAQTLKEDFGEFAEIIASPQCDLIKMLMEVGDGADTILAGAQGTASGGIEDAVGFQIQQTRDDLEVVLDPVMGFGKQQLFAGEIHRRGGLAGTL